MKSEGLGSNSTCLRRKNVSIYSNTRGLEMRNNQSTVASVALRLSQCFQRGTWFYQSWARVDSQKSIKHLTSRCAERLHAKYTRLMIAGAIRSKMIISNTLWGKMKFIKNSIIEGLWNTTTQSKLTIIVSALFWSCVLGLTSIITWKKISKSLKKKPNL